MDDWQEVIEEGKVYHIHNRLGNILKVSDNVFVAMMPKVIKLGPFKTLEQAKSAITENKEKINQVLEDFNDNLVIHRVRGE